MQSNWHAMQLGEFCAFAYGRGLAERKRSSGGTVPVFGSNGIIGFHAEALVSAPAVVIGRKGTVGAVHYSDVPCWPIDTTFFVSDEPKLRDTRYTYYLLKSLGLEHLNSDSAVPGLNRDHAHSLVVSIPPLAEQKRIAHILGTLDDKIELNRRMSATLEAMARALFKSWFVDFDPVRAKAAGRDPGLPADIAALFPAAFVESELGEVPAGWGVEPLDAIATFLNGLALQKYPAQGDDFLPVIKIAQLRQGNSQGADRASRLVPDAYVVNDGDVLFSWSGSLEVDIWCGGEGALNQHLFKVTSDRFPKWFYYLWTLEHLPTFRGIAAGKATTMGHIQRKHLTDALVVVPDAALLAALDAYVAPLLERRVVNAVQSRTLAALRDTLLPRLLSGAVRVTSAEETVNETLGTFA